MQNPELKSIQGKTLAEVAALWKMDPIDTIFEILIKDHAFTYVAVFGMSEPDVALAVAQPWVAFNNDSQGTAPTGILGQEHPHPRAYGTFPRVLRKFVREDKLLSLEEAIRKMAALPAQKMRLADRGVLKAGMWADVVVFDPRPDRRRRDVRAAEPALRRDGLRAGQRRAGDRAAARRPARCPARCCGARGLDDRRSRATRSRARRDRRGAARAQAQTPFKSGASTVAVYTTVTDAAGRLVPDLGRDSFEVYDNGKPQTISTFAADVQPITLVMMLDRSLSMLSNFRLVETAAGVLVDRLLPADKARIGSFSDRIQIDPRDVHDRQGGDAGRSSRPSCSRPGRRRCGTPSASAMTALLHQEGRRVVLVFTDGMDRPGNGGAHNVSFKDVVKRAEQEDVMVYGIGLAGGMPFGRGGYGGRGMGGYGGRGGGGGGGGGGAVDKPDPGLEKLALASGGGYFELTGTRDLSATFARVVDELHRQYLIGFVPQKLDGKAHKLEVRVKGEGLDRARPQELRRGALNPVVPHERLARAGHVERPTTHTDYQLPTFSQRLQERDDLVALRQAQSAVAVDHPRRLSGVAQDRVVEGQRRAVVHVTVVRPDAP